MIQKKISMLGGFAVGKTSLVRRFVESIFSEKYHTTIGVKIDKKVVDVDGQPVTLVLWDIAGEDGVWQVPLSYLRGSSGYLLVCDGTRQDTLDVALSIRRRVEDAFGALPFILAFNKNDLEDQWQIEPSDIEALQSQGVELFVTSAKTGEGVDAAFDALARRITS